MRLYIAIILGLFGDSAFIQFVPTGMLVVEDNGKPILLKTKNINIRQNSSFHIGRWHKYS